MTWIVTAGEYDAESAGTGRAPGGRICTVLHQGRKWTVVASCCTTVT